VWELSLGLWMTIKGFRSEALLAAEQTERTERDIAPAMAAV
jgi:hypothetical protein